MEEKMNIVKIEVILGDTKKVWAEIDPTNIDKRHAKENVCQLVKAIWYDAREAGDLETIHGGYRLCTVAVTTKTLFGESKQTFSI
jgi:hypothetical protein